MVFLTNKILKMELHFLYSLGLSKKKQLHFGHYIGLSGGTNFTENSLLSPRFSTGLGPILAVSNRTSAKI